MRKKLAIGILCVLSAPFAGWLCLSGLFATMDAFEKVFAHGSPMDKAANIITGLLSALGCFASAILGIFGLQSTIEALERDGHK